MAASVVSYGLGVLRRLVKTDTKAVDGDTDMEEGEQADEVVESKYLGEVTAETVQQHVELVFALSRRQQDLLDDIFHVYPKMETPVQDAVESLLTPLIQSLGASPKLLDVLRSFPPGADRLALRVVTILSAEGASPVLVSLVKGLLAGRELDPRFFIPIIGELDKVGYTQMTTADNQAEIERQIPRIVSLLGGSDSRDLVRTAFASVLQKMTPADLLVSLHVEETGLKATIEGEQHFSSPALCLPAFCPADNRTSHRHLLLNDHRFPLRRPRQRPRPSRRSPHPPRRLPPHHYPSRHDLQIPHSIHRQQRTAKTSSEEDLGDPAAMGRLREVGEDDCPGELWESVAVAQGLVEGRCGETAGVEAGSERVSGGETAGERGVVRGEGAPIQVF